MNWVEFVSLFIEIISRIALPSLAFVESMTQYLAWPLTVIILALLLRGRLLDAIERLAGIEGFGFKLWFAQKTSAVRGETEEQVWEQASEQVAEPAEQVQEPVEPVEEPAEATDHTAGPGQPVEPEQSKPITPRQYVEFIRENSRRKDRALALSATVSRSGPYPPRATVLESFNLVELALRDLDAVATREPHKIQSVPVLVKSLVQRDIISGQSANSILAMFNLRSAVVHTEEPVSVDSAKDYAASVFNILKILGDAFPRALRRRS